MHRAGDGGCKTTADAGHGAEGCFSAQRQEDKEAGWGVGGLSSGEMHRIAEMGSFTCACPAGLRVAHYSSSRCLMSYENSPTLKKIDFLRHGVKIAVLKQHYLDFLV